MGNYHTEIGKELKALRLEQKKELKDIAKDTKVSESYLEAIEDGRIEEFPSIIYYNLFARSYARELGLDPETMFASTTAENLESDGIEALGQETAKKEIKPVNKNEINGDNSSSKPGLWIAAIAVIVIVATIYFLSSDDDADSSEIKKAPTPTAAELTVDNSSLIVSDSAAQQENIDTIPTPLPEPIGPEMKLRIDVTNLSWLLVMADGDTVLNRNLDSGSYRTIMANEQFLLSAGNPNGLVMRLNDTLMKPLSPTGRPVRNFEITNLNKDQHFQVVDEANSEGSDPGEL